MKYHRKPQRPTGQINRENSKYQLSIRDNSNLETVLPVTVYSERAVDPRQIQGTQAALNHETNPFNLLYAALISMFYREE
jgi:hypothetical protein